MHIYEIIAIAKEFNDKNEKLMQLIKNQSLNIDEFKQYIEEITKENAKLADENAKLADENAKLADENAKLIGNNFELTSKNTKLADENTKLADVNVKLINNNFKLTIENTKLANENVKLTDVNVKLADENTNLVDENTKLTKDKTDHFSEIASFKDTIDDLKEHIPIDHWANILKAQFDCARYDKDKFHMLFSNDNKYIIISDDKKHAYIYYNSSNFSEKVKIDIYEGYYGINEENLEINLFTYPVNVINTAFEILNKKMSAKIKYNQLKKIQDEICILQEKADKLCQ